MKNEKSDTPTTHEGRDGRDASGQREKRTSHRPGGASALIGTTLSGRYRIDRILGEGGMGAVYEAEHTHMRKRLAVKVLHPEMSRLPEVVARFEREAMAAAHIDHPNVAAATDFGKLEDGSFFLVLEFVEGHSLREVVARGRLELGRALHIAHQIAQALLRAHALGIVHRDLKPENVMLVEKEGDPDFVKVLDFGIAKVPVGALASEEPAASAASGAPKILTQLGMVYGTPEYMAPEQALGQSVDARADLYGVGVMLYEMLCGTRPFDHASKVSLLGMHVTARVPPFAERCPEALVPPEVEQLVMKLLSKEASDRFADAKELIEAFLGVMALLIERHRIEPRVGGVPLMAPSTSSPNLASLLGPMSARVGSNPLTSPGAMRSPLGSAPTRIASGESGAIHVGLRPRSNRLATILATVLGALSLLVLVAVIVAGRTTKKTGAPEADGAVAVAPSGSSDEPPTPKESSDDDKIAGALASIDKGDYGTGIATLTVLEPRDIDRADIHRGLVKAYLATSAPADAMREASLLVKVDPTAGTDPKLLEDVRNAALGAGPAAEAALELLASGMGPKGLGIDVLYDVAHAQWASEYPQAAAKAQRMLAKPEIRARGTPALQVAVDLRSAGTCEKKRALLPRASEAGDLRALGVLKAYVPNRGCGFLASRDCWPCMHKDGSLAKAIAAIEERTAKK